LVSVAFNPGVINTDMLRSTFGKEAANYPPPEEWAVSAVDRLTGITRADNGTTIIA